MAEQVQEVLGVKAFYQRLPAGATLEDAREALGEHDALRCFVVGGKKLRGVFRTCPQKLPREYEGCRLVIERNRNHPVVVAELKRKHHREDLEHTRSAALRSIAALEERIATIDEELLNY